MSRGRQSAAFQAIFQSPVFCSGFRLDSVHTWLDGPREQWVSALHPDPGASKLRGPGSNSASYPLLKDSRTNYLSHPFPRGVPLAPVVKLTLPCLLIPLLYFNILLHYRYLDFALQSCFGPLSLYLFFYF